jgi:hypothetical protein
LFRVGYFANHDRPRDAERHEADAQLNDTIAADDQTVNDALNLHTLEHEFRVLQITIVRA